MAATAPADEPASGTLGHAETVEVGQEVELSSKAYGRNKQVRHVLMRAHGTEWKKPTLRGKVVAKGSGDKCMVEVDLQDEKMVLNVRESLISNFDGMQGEDLPQDPLPKDDYHELLTAKEDWDSDGSMSMVEHSDDGLAHDKESFIGYLDGEMLAWERYDPEKSMGKGSQEELSLSCLNWTPALQDPKHRSEVDYWKFLLPWDFFFDMNRPEGCCLGWTNQALPEGENPFSVQEWLQCIGVLYAKALCSKGEVKEMWESGSEGIVPPLNVSRRFNISMRRFATWRKHLKLWRPSVETAENKSDMIRPLICAFNQHRAARIEAGSELTVEDCKGSWMPSLEGLPEGMRNLVRMVQSTQGGNADFKLLFECSFGLVMALELKDAKQSGGNKTIPYPRHASAILRLAQEYLGKNRIIYANSDFTSLATAKALLTHGTRFTGELGSFSRGIPRAFIRPPVCQTGAHRVVSETAQVSVKIDDDKHRVFVHSWNDCSTPSAHRKVLVSTVEISQVASDHVKCRRRVDPATGNYERIKRTVPVTETVKSYLSATAVVEVHRHLSSEIQEMCSGHEEWWFGIFCQVLIHTEVDAFKIQCSAHAGTKSTSHMKFLDRLCAQLLANSPDSSNAVPKQQHREKKRARTSVGETESGAEKREDQHSLITILDFMKQNHNYSPNASDLKWGKRVRCRMCKGAQGWGSIANFCCQLCSGKDSNKKPFGICGPGTGRDCYIKHLSQATQQT
eukprot:765943-Hanusia_phi.AAC.3